jgi:hypothetical protein
MKVGIKTFFTISLILASSLFSGCATIWKNSNLKNGCYHCDTIPVSERSRVYFSGSYTSLKLEGQSLSTSDLDAPHLYSFGDAFMDQARKTQTSYTMPGIIFSNKKDVELEVTKNGETKTIHLKRKFKWKYLWLNGYFLGIGHAVDFYTGAWFDLLPEDQGDNLVRIDKYFEKQKKD